MPVDVARWLRHQERALTGAGGVPDPREPLVLRRGGKRLSIRLLGDGGQRSLVLEEHDEILDPTSLAPLGLTRRQNEVLVWVVEGKTNEELGVTL